MSLGDRQLASTVVTNFTTAVGGLPTVLSGSPAISVYKNNTTESTTGVTLNVSYDSRVGMNQVVIDTSADGTFYATGNDFSIVLTAGTVGGVSVVGTVVEEFSIGKGNIAYLASQAITAAAGVTFPSSIASPTNITAGTITTVTTLTNLPAITSNWLTAAGIAASALNGKGDWLLASSYTAPSNLTAAQIATGVWTDTTAGDFTTALSVGKSVMNGVTLGTGLTVNNITTKTGYSITGTITTLDGLATHGDSAWATATGFATPTNITAGTITTVTNLTNAPTNGDLTAAMIASVTGAVPTAAANATALLDSTNAVETGLTPRGLFRLIGAVLAGKISGAATTTNTFRNAVADSKDRVTATVDTDGNRTAITTDTT